jgi:hypothetical protein
MRKLTKKQNKFFEQLEIDMARAEKEGFLNSLK